MSAPSFLLTSQECLLGHPTFCLGKAASGNGVAAPEGCRQASIRSLKRARFVSATETAWAGTWIDWRRAKGACSSGNNVWSGVTPLPLPCRIPTIQPKTKHEKPQPNVFGIARRFGCACFTEFRFRSLPDLGFSQWASPDSSSRVVFDLGGGHQFWLRCCHCHYALRKTL